jgi:hypothetical protein
MVDTHPVCKAPLAENGSGSLVEEQRRKPKGYFMKIAQQGNSAEQSEERAATSISVVRGATGPRTQQGKQKSKRNALKHGIFSKVVLLKEEPRAEFDSLLRGLRNDLRPEGTLEELLVDNLVTISWRKRRLLIAEGAEIRKGTEFVDSDMLRGAKDEEASILLEGGPLVRKTANARILGTCIEMLGLLKGWIETEDFDETLGEGVRTLLYGEYGPSVATVFDQYLKIQHITRSNASAGHQTDPSYLEKCKGVLLSLLDEEIRRFKNIQCEQLLEESNRIEIEWLRGNVPDAPQLDRLLRYETTLQRDFDRTLSQLERLQRMRLGQLVLPKLEVSHTIS